MAAVGVESKIVAETGAVGGASSDPTFANSAHSSKSLALLKLVVVQTRAAYSGAVVQMRMKMKEHWK
jgi:hypothetical protein